MVALDTIADGVTILVIAVVDAVLGALRTTRAAWVIDQFGPVAVAVTVWRDGHSVELPAREPVVDDVIEFAAGDRVPADVVVAGTRQLEVDESLVTGRPSPVMLRDVPGGHGIAVWASWPCWSAQRSPWWTPVARPATGTPRSSQPRWCRVGGRRGAGGSDGRGDRRADDRCPAPGDRSRPRRARDARPDRGPVRGVCRGRRTGSLTCPPSGRLRSGS